jgi:ABC-type multidrug transport system fused ATPase/permease subunit
MKSFFINLEKVFKISSTSLILISIISLLVSLTEILGLGFLQVFLISIFSNENTDNNSLFSFLKKFNFFGLDIDKILLFYFLTFFYILKNILQIFLNFIFFTFIEKQHVNLLSVFFSVTLSKNYQEIIRNKSTKYNQLFSRYIENFIKNIIGGTLKIFSEIIFVFFVLVYLAYVNFVLTFYILFILLFFFLFYNLLIKSYLTKNSKKISETEEILKNTIYEYIKNFREIFIFRLKKSFFYKFQLHSNNFTRYEKKYLFIASLARNILEVLLIIFILGYLIYNKNNLENSFSSIAIIIFALIRLLPSVNTLNHNLAQISQHSYSTIELQKFINLKYKKFNFSTNVSLIIKKKLNYIKLNNLGFNFLNNNYLFKHLNFKFYLNEIILIKGKSGTGKTTLVDLLTGILKPTEGKVLFFDKNNKKFNFNNFGYVSQSPTLFSNTLAYNLTFKEQLTQNEKEKLIHLINKIDLNLGSKTIDILNHEISEDGKNLSGGQLKKISLIRNYFFDPKVIILDEITANLDQNSSKKVIDLINENKKDKIHFIISHKNEKNINFDKTINL